MPQAEEGVGRRISVHVVWLKARNTFVLRAVDADDQGQKILEQRSADTTRRKDADRLVPAFLEEMQKLHGDPDAESTGWRKVCRRYDREELAGMSVGGRNKFWNAVNKLDDIAKPKSLFAIDGNTLSKFRGGMQAAGLSQDTVIGYLAEISRCLNWAAGVWKSYQPPKIRKPKRKKRRGPRGRPITREEFERMLRAIKKVDDISEANRKSWRHFLVGLFLSGLRISEALDLSWDRSARVHVCDLEAKRARLYFRDQKSHKEGRSPITRAFDRFLRKAPADRRRGPVFSPRLSKGRVIPCTASKTVAAIGNKAGVIVGSRRKIDPETQEATTVTRYASAHDLRRTFATRLAPKVQSAAILALYLRDTIQTAEAYYVDIDLEAAEAAEKIPKHDQIHDQTPEGKTTQRRNRKLSKNMRKNSE